MPKFLARFRRRPAAAAEEPTESSAVVTEPWNTPPVTTADLGQKIHPNLDELVSTFTAPPPPPTPAVTPRAPIDDVEGSIIPLKPAVGRPRDARSPQTSANSPILHPTSLPESDSTNKNELAQGSNESLVHTPPPGSPQSPAPPSSWSTFGRTALKGAKSIPNIIDRSRPSTAGSRSTSRTTAEGTPDPLTPYASVSSGSMPSSGFTFGHGRVVPPLPPLDHPAFSGDVSLDVEGLPVSLKDDREVVQFLADKQPRPSISLPSMPSSSGVSWLKESSSRPRVQDIFPSRTGMDSPVKGRRRSDASRGSRRRRTRRSQSASVLNQHVQAGDASDAEYKGSRETSLFTSDYGNLQARGDSSQASGALGLGSPFLLQSVSAGEPYNLSTSTTDDNNSIPQNSTSLTGPSLDNSTTISSISKSNSSPGNEKTNMSLHPSPSPPVSPGHSPSTLLMPPSLSVTGPTPESSPVVEPTTPSRSKGKRKADEVEGPGGTPPEAKKSGHQKTTFATQDPRPHRASGTGTSGSSHAPSSFHRSKRARLSGSATPGSTIASVMSSVGEDALRPASRSGNHQQNASNTGSWASRVSAPYRTQSRTSGRNSSHHQKTRTPSEAPSRRSISQASIPISALISPHAPSISQRSTTYHMRDPRKPAPVQSTPWSLTLPERGWQRWTDGGGSPLHAWMFFIGFVLFPLWWVAALLVRIPKTREIGTGAEEKGVMLDDPQVEHDAISWRRRCRVMAVVSLFTYVPFIVCIAIFAPR